MVVSSIYGCDGFLNANLCSFIGVCIVLSLSFVCLLFVFVCCVASTSYQVSPGVEKDRPKLGKPTAGSNWYNHGLEFGENSTENIFFFGVELTHLDAATTYQTDAISANTNLTKSHFNNFHKYRYVCLCMCIYLWSCTHLRGVKTRVGAGKGWVPAVVSRR